VHGPYLYIRTGLGVSDTDHAHSPEKSSVDSLPENGCQRIVSSAMLILAHEPPARAHQNKDIAP
jgi:hypothetical protein